MSLISRVRHNLACVHLIEGDLVAADKRRCEGSLVEHLSATGIVLDEVNFGTDSGSFAVSRRDALRLESAIRDLNVAVKIRDHCARIVVTRSATDPPLPSIVKLLTLIDEEGIGVVSFDANTTSLTMLVDENDSDRVTSAVERLLQPSHTTKTTAA